MGIKLGLVGLGAIGQMVAKRLMDLDVEVYAYDPFVKKEKEHEIGEFIDAKIMDAFDYDLVAEEI